MTDQTPCAYEVPCLVSRNLLFRLPVRDQLNSCRCQLTTTLACNNHKVVDESIINYEAITSLLEYITVNFEEGAILVFLPGLAEITKMLEALAENSLFNDKVKGFRVVILDPDRPSRLFPPNVHDVYVCSMYVEQLFMSCVCGKKGGNQENERCSRIGRQ